MTPMHTVHTVEFMSQLQNLGFKKMSYKGTISKPGQFLPLEGDIIFIILLIKQLFAQLWQETL